MTCWVTDKLLPYWRMRWYDELATNDWLKPGVCDWLKLGC